MTNTTHSDPPACSGKLYARRAILGLAVTGFFLPKAALAQGIKPTVRATLVHRFPVEDSSDSLCFSPDGGMLAVGGQEGRLRLYNTSTLLEIATFVMAAPDQGAQNVEEIAFHPDGNTLAATSSVHGGHWFVSLWDVRRKARIIDIKNQDRSAVTFLVRMP